MILGAGFSNAGSGTGARADYPQLDIQFIRQAASGNGEQRAISSRHWLDGGEKWLLIHCRGRGNETRSCIFAWSAVPVTYRGYLFAVRRRIFFAS